MMKTGSQFIHRIMRQRRDAGNGEQRSLLKQMSSEAISRNEESGQNPVEETASTFWRQPWGYQQSFLIVGGAVITGFLIEYADSGAGIAPPMWPVNAAILVLLIFAILVLHTLRQRSAFVRWLGSIPASVSAIVCLFLLSLIAGIVPQRYFGPGAAQSLGLHHIINSWAFALCVVFVLFSLGLAAARRLFPSCAANLGFLANHLGLWIIIAGLAFGAGDLERLRMNLTEGETTDEAVSADERQRAKMPFSLKLHDFRIDEFQPQLTIVDQHGFFKEQRRNDLAIVKPDAAFALLDWQIKVEEYLPSALPTTQGFVESAEIGSAPAAYVRAVNKNTGQEKIGWLSTAEVHAHPFFIPLSAGEYLVMTTPRPKKFRSTITVYDSTGQQLEDITLEVNRPYSVAGWMLYQLGYDERMGKWSKLSVIEVVRDPWLPVVYTGIALMLLGSFEILLRARKKIS